MSMKREPNWVDFANWCENRRQSVQLTNLQNLTDQLAQIQQARERQTQASNEFRQVIVEAEECVKALVQYTNRAPTGVFVSLSVLRDTLTGLGIVPSAFPEFRDKECVREFYAHLDQELKQVSSTMPEEDLGCAQLVSPRISGLGGLNTLIRDESVKEERSRLNGELERLEQARKQALKRWGVLAILGGFGLCLGVVCYWVVWATFESVLIFPRLSGMFRPVVVPWLVLCGLWCLDGVVMCFIRGNSRELNKRKAQRVLLRARLLSPDRYHELCSVWGEGKTSREYEALRDDVLGYWAYVTERDRDGNPLPQSLVEIGMPSSLGV